MSDLLLHMKYTIHVRRSLLTVLCEAYIIGASVASLIVVTTVENFSVCMYVCICMYVYVCMYVMVCTVRPDSWFLHTRSLPISCIPRVFCTTGGIRKSCIK